MLIYNKLSNEIKYYIYNEFQENILFTWKEFLFCGRIYDYWSLNFKNCILIRFHKMQQYAGTYLLQNYSTCFGCPSHPSSGVHKTVTAASGTGHNIWATTFLQCGLIRPQLQEGCSSDMWYDLYQRLQLLCTSDDGSDGYLKHVE